MWDMLGSSFHLFLKGKLFREPGAAFRQWLIGFALSAVAVVILVKMAAPVWLTIIVVALAGGALQPFLFKNLKYD
jgi:hypothetical protein